MIICPLSDDKRIFPPYCSPATDQRFESTLILSVTFVSILTLSPLVLLPLSPPVLPPGLVVAAVVVVSAGEVVYAGAVVSAGSVLSVGAVVVDGVVSSGTVVVSPLFTVLLVVTSAPELRVGWV